MSEKPTYGLAGKIAAAWMQSKLTPLVIVASLALGLRPPENVLYRWEWAVKATFRTSGERKWGRQERYGCLFSTEPGPVAWPVTNAGEGPGAAVAAGPSLNWKRNLSRR